MKTMSGIKVVNQLMGRPVALNDRCCGESGTLAVTRPDVSTQVRFRKQEEMETGAARLRAAVVPADEREREGGGRTALNFGHTLAHAIEAARGYRGLLHGEAVAIGMRAAAELSAAQVGLSAEAHTRLEVALDHLRLPVTMPATPLRALLAAMSNDKKSARGDVRWVLTPQIGVASVPRAVDHSLVRAALLHAGARS
jgi:3-dehydroquinate synthetase